MLKPHGLEGFRLHHPSVPADELARATALVSQLQRRGFAFVTLGYERAVHGDTTAGKPTPLVGAANAAAAKHFGLTPAQKCVFRSARRDEGYSRSPSLGKETFAWRFDSPGLRANQPGALNALGRLSASMLHLGADVLALAFEQALNVDPGTDSGGGGGLWTSRGLVCPETSVLQVKAPMRVPILSLHLPFSL